MKKSLKDTFKEIWADEPYQEHGSYSHKKSLGKKILEGGINFARYELFYPKLKEVEDIYDISEYPKGALPAVIVNTLLGAYIGGQINNKDGWVAGAVAGFFTTVGQYFLGSGARDFIDKKFNIKTNLTKPTKNPWDTY